MSAPGGRVLGMLHTVPALAATFEALVADASPGVQVVHVVDPWLLRTAIATGVDTPVHERVQRHVRHLAETGAGAVLVTCSSIGETVAGAAGGVNVPVVRVDRAMAHEAVALATSPGARGRIAVLATLESTLGPTGRLVAEAVGGRDVAVEASVVAGAAAAKDAGDQARHDQLVRDAVTAATAGADVVVLAQASMAAALDGVTTDVPVLTSPQGGVRAALEALGVPPGT